MKITIIFLIIVLGIMVVFFSYGPIRNIISPKAMTADEFDPNRFNIHRYNLQELELLFKDLFPVGVSESEIDAVMLTANSRRLRKSFKHRYKQNCFYMDYIERPKIGRDFKGGYSYQFFSRMMAGCSTFEFIRVR